jgi:hypothetical protein
LGECNVTGEFPVILGECNYKKVDEKINSKYTTRKESSK